MVAVSPELWRPYVLVAGESPGAVGVGELRQPMRVYFPQGAFGMTVALAAELMEKGNKVYPDQADIARRECAVVVVVVVVHMALYLLVEAEVAVEMVMVNYPSSVLQDLS